MRMPRAAQLQGGSNGADVPLLALARKRQPRVRWWWGIRKWWVPDDPTDPSPFAVPNRDGVMSVQRNGAWCYLCDNEICHWSSRWPVTASALQALKEHRNQHIQGRLEAAPTGDKR